MENALNEIGYAKQCCQTVKYEARATMNQTEPGIGWFLNHLLTFWAHMKGLTLLFNLVYRCLIYYKK